MIRVKKNRIKLISSILFATLILSFVSSIVVSSLAAETSLRDSDQLKERFNFLYLNDAEFRSNVDECRALLSGYFSDNEWLLFRQLFDKQLIKIGLGSLDELSSEDLEEMRKYVEHEAANFKKVKFQSTYVEQTTMSPQSEIDIARQYVPRLLQPDADIAYPALNGVYRIYVDVHDQQVYSYYVPNYYFIEVSIVWFDEDHPSQDYWYDVLRMNIWGRIEDIETFFICVYKPQQETKWISFIACQIAGPSIDWRNIDPSYNNYQTFYQGSDHNEARVYEGYFQQIGEHPKLWVNTWNHMMAETDTNPTMTDTTHDFWVNWTLYSGNRYVTENAIIGSAWYNNEQILEIP